MNKHFSVLVLSCLFVNTSISFAGKLKGCCLGSKEQEQEEESNSISTPNTQEHTEASFSKYTTNRIPGLRITRTNSERNTKAGDALRAQLSEKIPTTSEEEINNEKNFKQTHFIHNAAQDAHQQTLATETD